MSKEHTPASPSLFNPLRLAAAVLLLCIPLMPPLESFPPAAFALTAGTAALGALLAAELLRRLPPFAANRPRILWPLLLAALTLPRLLPVLPPALPAALHLLPLLLLLRLHRLPLLPRLLLALPAAAALTLWTGPATTAPALRPLLPALLIPLTPLLLCLRSPWRPFAIPLATTGVTLLLLTLNLAPLPFWQNTARMTATEARERPAGTPPAPRYQPAPNAPSPLPDDITPALAAFIHARQTALSPPALQALFTDAPLPPDEMIRALRVYGFIQHDRHGYHIPAEAFTLDPARHLAPEYTVWVEKLRTHAGIDPDTLDPDLLRDARRLGILLPVRPGSPLLRFSANHRARLANSLYPRQILTLLSLTPDTPPLTTETYAQTWSLSLDTAETELRELAATGHLTPLPWQTDAIRPPDLSLPDANRALRILLRLALAALGLWLLRPAPAPLRTALHLLGGLSLWGFLATELAAGAATLPAAANTALWLTPLSLLLLLLPPARNLPPPPEQVS